MNLRVFILPLAVAGAACGETSDDSSGPGELPRAAPYCDPSVRWTLRPSATTSIPSAVDVTLASQFEGAIEREAAFFDEVSTATGCLDRAVIDRARAMLSLGDTAGCLALALGCLEGEDALEGALGVLAFSAVQCAIAEDEPELALELFERSTDPALEDTCGDRAGRVFSYAAFLIGRGDSDRADAILTRAPSLDAASTRAALEYWIGTSGTLDDFRAIVASAFEGTDAVLASTAFSMWLSLLWQDALSFEVRALVSDNLEAIEASRAVIASFPVLYVAFYSTTDGAHFALVDRIYRPYARAAIATSWLPVELNSHTYTEQYQTECADGLLQGDVRARYRDLTDRWKSGAVADVDALGEAQALLAEAGEAADVLTFIGTLLERAGAIDAAFEHLIRAHRACIFFNRSHSAIQKARRWIQLQRRDNFQERTALRAEVLAELGEVPALSDYVANFASLSPDQVDGVKYALRFWVQYLDVLVTSGSSLYVKHSFELLSEVPGFRYLRDTRVEYDGDYRLWDDVGGIGGVTVAVDVNEMMFNPYGGYNLVAHELAHQVEQIGPSAFARCIGSLYEAAKERDLFVNYYSSNNQSEYFAEGVVTFLLPSDAPPYFGRNRTWLAENDPDLSTWVEQLSVGTPLEAMLCPLP